MWNHSKPRTPIRMQERINRFEIRCQLGVESLRTKIQITALQRTGHILRLPDQKIVKKVVLGSWNKGEPIKVRLGVIPLAIGEG